MRTAFLGANVIGMNTHDKYTESNIFKKIAAKTMRNSYFLDESLLANIIPTRKGKISKGIKFVITRRIQQSSILRIRAVSIMQQVLRAAIDFLRGCRRMMA